jgi:hypothetical protein
MKTNILFQLKLPYLKTEYSILKPLAITIQNLGKSTFLWTFKAEQIQDVIRALGKPIEFDLTPLLPYAPAVNKVLTDKSRKKGTGYFKIIGRFPKIFTYETIIDKKTVKKTVPTENIQVAWEVMKKYPLNKPVKSRTVGDKIIEKLGITRFNRETGTFSWEKFFGCRTDYYKYFYGPIKILQADDVIKHHTDGRVERISNDWQLQLQLEEEG